MPTLSAVPPDTGLDAPQVVIGTYTYSVVPQRIGRLKKRLGPALGSLQELQGDSLVGFVSDSLERSHAVLKVFIPDLMPLYEFSGYRSEAAMEADEDEEGEFGPTIPDIINAFEVVMKVNRLDLLGHLRTVISPEIIKALITNQIAESIRSTSSPSQTSASLPGLDSDSMSSSTIPPTSTPSAG